MRQKEITIATSPNGPLAVKNIGSLTESNGNIFPINSPSIALCRCGGSARKPFCDGTHARAGWTDEKQEGGEPRQSDSYEGKHITVHDDRGICSHAGFCTDGLPKMFRVKTEPWIDPDAESVEKIVETIEKCPSGALSYSIGGKLYNEFSRNPEIKITENGPYYVRGGIVLRDADRPASPEHYALCRCGRSRNKPFCDGQHWFRRFRDDGKVKPVGQDSME